MWFVVKGLLFDAVFKEYNSIKCRHNPILAFTVPSGFQCEHDPTFPSDRCEKFKNENVDTYGM